MKDVNFFTFAMSWQHARCYLCCRRMITGVENSHGRRRVTEDHVVPRSAGGGRVGNIALACNRCNVKRGSAVPTPCQVFFAAQLRAAWQIAEEFRSELWLARNVQKPVSRLLTGIALPMFKPEPTAMECAFARAFEQGSAA